ncbi:MAG TPA: hypothetical protein VF688_00130 [Allosphingosinicella sp.]
MSSITVCLAGASLLSACAAKPAPAPVAERAPPVHRPEASPVAAAPVETAAQDWRDLPLSPGDWSYDPATNEARYADFSLRCDSARRQIVAMRAGGSGPLRLRTTYGERVLPAGGALAAADPLLDEMAFSRGRFTVDGAGVEPLVLPAWPEPARVVEDCRG